MPKDKELADHERAHSGVPGSKVKHGANAVGEPSPAWKKRKGIQADDKSKWEPVFGPEEDWERVK